MTATLALLTCVLTAACGDDGAPADGGRRLDGGDVDSGPACADPARTTPDAWPCVCESDCLTGAFCVTEERQIIEAGAGFPGGACGRVCVIGTECMPGYVCAPDPFGGPGLCAKTCTANADCAPANSCVDFSDTGPVCLPYCQSDAECRSGHCDRYRGLCTDGNDLMGGGVEAPCAADTDCRSGTCVESTENCLVFCSLARGGCPEEAICTEFNDDDDRGYCNPPCETSADCTPYPNSICQELPIPAGVLVCD